MDGVMYKQFDKEVKVVVVVMNGVMDKQVDNEVEKEVNKVVFLGAGNCIKTVYLTENFKIGHHLRPGYVYARGKKQQSGCERRGGEQHGQVG